MSRQLAFNRELTHLFEIRTYWLRHLFKGKSRGKKPRLTRKNISRTINQLQAIATSSEARKLAREGFQKSARAKRTWRVTKRKGHGRDEKKRNFQLWYERVITAPGCVYVFWNHRKCIYVGRTGKGGKRPSEHFIKFWFSGVTRIDVYEVRAKRPLAALECLAIHRFRPSRNKLERNRKCPLCAIHRDIKGEIQTLFRLTHKRRKHRR